jgi:hypothetical protein
MKNRPKKQKPSTATAGQSWRIGQRTRNTSATGSTQRKPMPQRSKAMVSGSAVPTR